MKPLRTLWIVTSLLAILTAALLTGCTAPPLIAPAAPQPTTQTAVVGSGNEVSGAGFEIVTQSEQVVVPAAPQPGRITIEGDETLLKSFVERWMNLDYSGVGAGATLLLGQLPKDLPLDLPLPEGARVIGSVTNEVLGGAQLYLTLPFTPTQAIAYLTAELADDSFQPLKFPDDALDVFKPATLPQQAMLCSEPLGVSLSIHTAQSPDDASQSDVVIALTTYQDDACKAMLYPQTDGQKLLPSLIAPAGAQIGGGSGGGSGGSNTSAYAQINISIDLSASELAEHYNALLRQAGWTLLKQSASDDVAWSSWQFEDERQRVWAGTLTVSRPPAQANAFSVELRIERALQPAVGLAPDRAALLGVAMPFTVCQTSTT